MATTMEAPALDCSTETEVVRLAEVLRDAAGVIPANEAGTLMKLSRLAVERLIDVFREHCKRIPMVTKRLIAMRYMIASLIATGHFFAYANRLVDRNIGAYAMRIALECMLPKEQIKRIHDNGFTCKDAIAFATRDGGMPMMDFLHDELGCKITSLAVRTAFDSGNTRNLLSWFSRRGYSLNTRLVWQSVMHRNETELFEWLLAETILDPHTLSAKAKNNIVLMEPFVDIMLEQGIVTPEYMIEWYIITGCMVEAERFIDTRDCQYAVTERVLKLATSLRSRKKESDRMKYACIDVPFLKRCYNMTHANIKPAKR
jgi:hypothetical protein